MIFDIILFWFDSTQLISIFVYLYLSIFIYVFMNVIIVIGLYVITNVFFTIVFSIFKNNYSINNNKLLTDENSKYQYYFLWWIWLFSVFCIKQIIKQQLTKKSVKFLFDFPFMADWLYGWLTIIGMFNYKFLFRIVIGHKLKQHIRARGQHLSYFRKIPTHWPASRQSGQPSCIRWKSLNVRITTAATST